MPPAGAPSWLLGRSLTKMIAALPFNPSIIESSLRDHIKIFEVKSTHSKWHTYIPHSQAFAVFAAILDVECKLKPTRLSKIRQGNRLESGLLCCVFAGIRRLPPARVFVLFLLRLLLQESELLRYSYEDIIVITFAFR